MRLGLRFVLGIPLLALSAAPCRADVTPRRLDGHKGPALAVAFRPDGKVLASGGKDQRIILWDAETGKQVASWEAHKGEVDWLAFSPDGKTLASTGKDGMACLWDADTKEKRAGVKATTSSATWVRFVFTPDSKTLIVTTIGGPTRFVDVASGKETLDKGFYGVCIALSPDGNSLVVGTGGGTGGGGLRLVEPAMKGGRPERVTRRFDTGVDAVAFHPEGKLVAAGYFERGGVKLWEVATGKLDTTIKAPGSVYAMTFSRDGKTLAFSNTHQVTCWDMTEKRQFILRGGDASLKQIAFHPDGRILAAAGERGVWLLAVTDKEVAEARKPKSVTRITGHSGFVELLVSPSGKVLCWRSSDTQSVGWLRLDEKSEQTAMALTRINPLWNHAIAFDKEERLIVASFFDPEPRAVPRFSVTPFGPTRHVRGETSFSPDRKTFAVGGSDVDFSRIDLKAKTLESLKDPKAMPTAPLPVEGVRMWSVASGKEVERLEGHTQVVLGAVWSPDGKRIASLSEDGEVRVWDLSTNKTTHKFHILFRWPSGRFMVGVQNELMFVDNRILAGLHGEVVTLWDVVAGKEIGRLEEPTTTFVRIVVSPDRKLLAAGSGNGEIHIWEVASRKRVAAFRSAEKGVAHPISALTFSPDGKTLFSGGAYTTITAWDLDAILKADDAR